MTADQIYWSLSLYEDGELTTEDDIDVSSFDVWMAETLAEVQTGHSGDWILPIKVDVFKVQHEHERIRIGSCECAQYELSHKPIRSYLVRKGGVSEVTVR